MSQEFEMLANTPATLNAVQAPKDKPIFDVKQIFARAKLIQELKTIMRRDVHFGIIPGTPKPSLFQPGAQLIASLFRIALEPTCEDISPPGEVAYRVTMRAGHGPTGSYLGSAVGICSTLEEKYAWRKPTCDEEYKATDPDRRREVWKRGGNGPYALKQVRQDPASQAQTVIGMASKRAMVAVIRQVTAASDLFTEGLEDLPPESQAAVAENNQQPQQQANKPTGDPDDYAGPTASEIREQIAQASTAEEFASIQELIRDLPSDKDRIALGKEIYSKVSGGAQ